MNKLKLFILICSYMIFDWVLTKTAKPTQETDEA